MRINLIIVSRSVERIGILLVSRRREGSHDVPSTPDHARVQSLFTRAQDPQQVYVFHQQILGGMYANPAQSGQMEEGWLLVRYQPSHTPHHCHNQPAMQVET